MIPGVKHVAVTHWSFKSSLGGNTMAEQKVCPECAGEKKIGGTCECNMEWRGNQQGDDWEDCLCSKEVDCPVCNGAGFIIEK